MSIDIVITTYNRKDLVRRAIDSALRTKPSQIIVVDDSSTDGTLDFLTHHYRNTPGVEIHQNVTNLGVSAAKNRGFQASSADWVIFLDSDDTLIAEAATQAFHELETQQDRPIVFFRCIDQNGAFVGTQRHTTKDLDLRTYVEHTSFGEALTAVNKRLVNHPPYVDELRGYEGLGCARLIQKFGPALLSNIEFRIYHSSGPNRLSDGQYFSPRTIHLAYGHFTFYKEFRYAMTPVKSAKMFAKVIIYRLMALVYNLSR